VIGAALALVKALTDRLVDAVHRSIGQTGFSAIHLRLTVSVSCGPFHQRPGGVCLGGRSLYSLFVTPGMRSIARMRKDPAPADRPQNAGNPDEISEWTPAACATARSRYGGRPPSSHRLHSASQPREPAIDQGSFLFPLAKSRIL